MKLLGWLATCLAALLGAGLGLLLILPLGLVVIEWVVFPLALAAGWVGTWPARDGTRTRLATVVVVTEAAGLGLALAVLGSAGLRGALLGPVIGVAGVCSLALAIAASAATGAFRRPASGRHHDLALTLTLLALAAAGVPTVVTVVGLAGLTGA